MKDKRTVSKKKGEAKKRELSKKSEARKGDTKKPEESGLFLKLHDFTSDNITLKWSYRRHDDWMDVNNFLLEFKATDQPEYEHIELTTNTREFTIENCSQATLYSITVTAIEINGGAISRSRPLVVETSGPIERPVLKLAENQPGAITLQWEKPKEFGKAEIKEYLFQVNGNVIDVIDANKTTVTYSDCRTLRTYTFKIKAVSATAGCDSEWSHILDVTCAGALPIALERERCEATNTVKLSWKKPLCQGNARIKEYRIYYRKVDDSLEQPSKDKIMNEEGCILHTLPATAETDTLKVEPDKYYWAILEAEISPDSCPNIVTPCIQLHAAVRPARLEIEVDMYGLYERMADERRLAYVVDKRDRQKLKLQTLKHSIKSDRSQNKEERKIERGRMDAILYNMTKELEKLLANVNKHTGTVSVVVKWKLPKFDEFCEPMGYRIFVNDEIYAENLPLDTKYYCIKLNADKPVYNISMITLSSHVVGHSDVSETLVINTTNFRPTHFFCYFNNHNMHARWPEGGGCCIEDTINYENQHTDRPFPHQALVNERVHAASFQAMGIFDGIWEPLGKYFGDSRPTALLFWTKWCSASKRAMEYYCSFAKTYTEQQFRLLTCCVFSDETVGSHQAKIKHVMTENNWSSDDGVHHFCACHSPPKSKLGKKDVPNSSLVKYYNLLGVPTLVLLDAEGYISWQGRIFADNAETFANHLRHVFCAITNTDCPVNNCDDCESEKFGVIYSKHKEKTAEETGKGSLEKFNELMNAQIERFGEGSTESHTRQQDDQTTRDAREAHELGDQGATAGTRSAKSFTRQQARSRTVTWSSGMKFRAGYPGHSLHRRSMSVNENVSRELTRITFENLNQEPSSRAQSALPTIGRRTVTVVLTKRPHTAEKSSKAKPQRSRYAAGQYSPWTPYKGTSYATHGRISPQAYNKNRKPIAKSSPKDTGFSKMASKNDEETREKKMKVPSHSERKYIRDADWR